MSNATGSHVTVLQRRSSRKVTAASLALILTVMMTASSSSAAIADSGSAPRAQHQAFFDGEDPAPFGDEIGPAPGEDGEPGGTVDDDTDDGTAEPGPESPESTDPGGDPELPESGDPAEGEDAAEPVEPDALSQDLDETLSNDSSSTLAIPNPTARKLTAPQTAQSPSPKAAAARVIKPVHLGLKKGTQRVSGGSRYATAINASKNYPAGVSTVFVAGGEKYHGPLIAAAAAAHSGGPLLLTQSGSLPNAVATEIRRLKPERIVVVGSKASVSAGVEAKLRAIAPTSRPGNAGGVYGISRSVVGASYTQAPRVFMATGRNWQEGAAASAAAGLHDAPVLLVDGKAKTLPAVTMKLLNKLGTRTVNFVGPQSSLPSRLAKQLRAKGMKVTRSFGSSYTGTAAAVTRDFFSKAKPTARGNTAVLTSSNYFWTGLVGASLAATERAPLVYLKAAYCVDSAQAKAVRSLKPASRVLVGGAASASWDSGSLLVCRPAKGRAIHPGQQLGAGQQLVSRNGKHVLQLSKNGNLSLYNNGVRAWQSKTGGNSGAYLTMAGKGELVLKAAGGVKWRGGSAGTKSGVMVLNDDGNLAIRRSANGATAWSLARTNYWRHNNRGPVAYAQRQPQWSGAWIGNGAMGPTGCVPTAMAMALGGYGVGVSPYDVGIVMHHHGDFNRGIAGAGSQSIRAAAAAYGVQASPLRNQKDIATALKSNRTVIALVRGPAAITNPGSTHAVTMHGYQNGTTTINNPNGAFGQRWNISTIWEWQSWDPFDWNAGAVFWAIG